MIGKTMKTRKSSTVGAHIRYAGSSARAVARRRERSCAACGGRAAVVVAIEPPGWEWAVGGGRWAVDESQLGRSGFRTLLTAHRPLPIAHYFGFQVSASKSEMTNSSFFSLPSER